MNWTRYRRAFGLLLFTVSLVALAWGLWPMSVHKRNLALSPAEMLPPGAAALSDTLDSRVLQLEWPAVIRTGDLASIRLVFSPVAGGASLSHNTPVAGQANPVLADARLELPGIPRTPAGEASQGFITGRPVMFIWDLLPDRVGEADGMVWLHLSFIPADGGATVRQVLTAQRIQIRVTEFLGLSGPWARALGAAGLVIGVILGFDGFILWLWRQSPVAHQQSNTDQQMSFRNR